MTSPQLIELGASNISTFCPVRGLTIDAILAQSDPEIERQRSLFQALKGELGESSPADIGAILADREVVNCEPELTTETIERLRSKLQVD